MFVLTYLIEICEAPGSILDLLSKDGFEATTQLKCVYHGALEEGQRMTKKTKRIIGLPP